MFDTQGSGGPVGATRPDTAPATVTSTVRFQQASTSSSWQPSLGDRPQMPEDLWVLILIFLMWALTIVGMGRGRRRR